MTIPPISETFDGMHTSYFTLTFDRTMVRHESINFPIILSHLLCSKMCAK